MSIASNLTAVATNLNSALDEINDKIESKGGTASDTVYGVAAAVENLPSGGSAQALSYGTGSQNSSILLSNGSYVSPNTASYAQGKFMSSEANNFIFNPASAEKSWRIISRFKKTQNTAYPTIWADSSSYNGPYGTDFMASQNTLYANFRANGSWKQVTVACPTELNIWYYAVLYGDVENKAIYISLYDDSGTLIKANCAFNHLLDANPSYYSKYGGGYSNSDWFVGYIDLLEACYEIDGVPVWGKTNSKTQNMGIFDSTDFSEFTEVEYIESTGTQFIQTDTVIYSTDKVEAEVVFVDKSLTTFAWCARESLNSKFFNALNLTGEFRFGYFDEQFTGPSVINNQKYKITMDGNKFYLDDALIKTFSQVNSNSVNPACLMASYNPYKNYANIGKMKHFGFRVWDNSSSIKANFVPCYHTATGIIGMFDLVNNKFYMNAGTGTFLKGADVNA